jgi:hypothetical protein
MVDMKQIKPRTYLIIGFVIMSLIIIGVIVFFYRLNTGKPDQVVDPKQTTYTDPGSGETIVTTDGKAPDTYGVDPDMPVYLGFTSLLSVGLSDEQVRNLKTAFFEFAVQNKPKEKITEISITVASIKQSIDRDAGSTYAFNLTMNRKTKYHAVVTSNDITSIHLTLSLEGQTTPLFTSTKG